MTAKKVLNCHTKYDSMLIKEVRRMMYLKDLTCRVNVRLSEEDMTFLKEFAKKNNMSLSNMMRSLLTSYRIHSKEGKHEHNETV